MEGSSRGQRRRQHVRGERGTVREEYGPTRQGATEKGAEGITDEGGATDAGGYKRKKETNRKGGTCSRRRRTE